MTGGAWQLLGFPPALEGALGGRGRGEGGICPGFPSRAALDSRRGRGWGARRARLCRRRRRRRQPTKEAFYSDLTSCQSPGEEIRENPRASKLANYPSA